MGEDGLWYYKCYTCEQFCPEHEMTVNRNKPFGKDIYCRDCKKLRRQDKTRKIITQFNKEYNTAWIEPMGRHLNLKGLTNEDIIRTIEFLKEMKYDTSQPIHKQFEKRIKDKYGVHLSFNDTPYQQREDNGF